MEHASVLVRELLQAPTLSSIESQSHSQAERVPRSLRVTEQQIQQLCIKYRLRFLPFSRYEKEVPSEAVAQVLHWEKTLGNPLSLFIAAPSKAFHLDNADDPILLALLPEGDYLYIDQWGTDISPWRRWLVWPFRSMGTFVATAVLLTLLLQCLFFYPLTSSGGFIPIIVFLFLFKTVLAIGGYLFFIMGKNFNDQIWNRPFYNN